MTSNIDVDSGSRPGLSRRGFLGATGAVGAALAAGLDWSRPAAAEATVDSPVLYRRQVRTARPGEAFVLTGSGFAAAALAMAWPVPAGTGSLPARPGRNSLALRVVAVTADGIVLQLPASARTGVYAIYVSSGDHSAWSAPLTVNEPSAWFVDRPTAVAGEQVTVYGEHLRSAAVSLVAGALRYACTVVETKAYSITFVVPRGVTGPCTVSVAGDRGTTKPSLEVATRRPCPTRILNAVSDFGADPTGAGDSTTALQAALTAAAATTGGAVVRLPAGLYTISAKLSLPNASGPVHVEGAGQGKSTIRMSDAVEFTPSLPRLSPTDIYGVGAGDDYGMLYLAPGDSAVEVRGLTFDTNLRRVVALELDGRNNVTVGDVAVENPEYPQDVWLYVGTFGLLAQNLRNLTVEGCDFHCGNAAFLIAVSDVRVQDSRMRLLYPRTPGDAGNPQHQADNSGVKIWGARRIVVRRNTFVRGSDTYYYARAVQTGGLKLPAQALGVKDAGGVEDCYFGDNTILNAGEPASNCGEVLVGDQFNSVQGGRRLLTVSAAGSTTISTTDVQFALDDPRQDPLGAMVVVLSGTGTGQLRRVVATTTDTLTLDEPWDVTPATDSTFVVTVLQQHQLYVGNTAKACPKYIGNYGPSALCVVAGNSFDTTGSVTANPPAFDLSGVLFTAIVTGNNPSALDVSVYNQILDNQLTTAVSALVYDDFSSLTLDTPVPPMLRGNVVSGNVSTGNESYAVRLVTPYGTPNPGRSFAELNAVVDNVAPTGAVANAAQDSVWFHTVYQGPSGGLVDGGSATIVV
ncbi:glycosyl hydrolase family 28-related protein [Kribbella sp. NPDC004536]|uniref:glycosyl hydrolase family 28-related protein n=1 Tax=Kribbella sp. NPDC004536 TaxID=3364106 RepID=UPI0036CF9633